MKAELMNLAKELGNIKLTEVQGSHSCQFTVIENKLAELYNNQEKILRAIKLSAQINLAVAAIED